MQTIHLDHTPKDLYNRWEFWTPTSRDDRLLCEHLVAPDHRPFKDSESAYTDLEILKILADAHDWVIVIHTRD